MRPFILRRVKEDVLQDLPGKTEMILYTGILIPTFVNTVGMSKMQKNYYKSILTHDTRTLALNKNSLMNGT